MSSVERWGGVRPGVEAAVDDVGEVAFEGAAGLARRLAFGDLAGEVGAGWWMVSGLDDGDSVEGGIELPVAAAVEPVPTGGLARAAGDGRGTAEPGEGGGVAEAADITGVCDHCGGDLRTGAVEVADRVAVLLEQLRDLGVEGSDPLVEVLDVAGEVMDAASRDPLDEAVAEVDPLEPAQLALSCDVDDTSLADGVDLIPVGAKPLGRLGAIADETASLQLEQRQRPHELGLERRSKLRASGQHDLGDRDRVARIGLARPVAAPLAMRAPGGHVEHLVARRLQRGNKQSAVAGRAFDTDERLAGIVLVEPGAEAPHTFRAVGEAERADLAATLVQERGHVAALVHIDPDDHLVLLSRG